MKETAKRCVGLAAGLVFWAFAADASAATIFVTSTEDGIATNGSCTLREAIMAANAGSTVDTCVAGPVSGGNKIELGGQPHNVKASTLGTMTISSFIEIVGQGYKRTTLRKDPSEANLATPSVFTVSGTANSSLTIRDMLITQFSSRVLTVNAGGYGSVFTSKLLDNNGNFFSSGSCFSNSGTLSISNSEIAGCDGTTGAGLKNFGFASIEYSSFVRNSAERGGAIYNGAGATLYLTGSTIGRNSVTFNGAALQNGGTAHISSSTIAYNRTDLDPFQSCTSSPTLCSAVQNTSGAYLEISGSVVAHNTVSSGQTEPNCVGSPSSKGGNLLGEAASTACEVVTLAGALPNQNPQNAGLNNSAGDPLPYGGVGRTYMPTTTSVLLNKLAGSSAPCQSPDQRGIRRWSLPCDIGAVERAPALLIVGNLSLSSGDSVLKFLLENLGFSVTVELSTATSAASANGKTLVVISESVTSSDVNTKFRDVFAGVLVLENALFDDMRMTGTTSGTDYFASNDFAVILQPGQIGSRFGALGVRTTTASTVAHSWGVPGSGAWIHATLNSSSSRRGIFSYWPGAAMVPSSNLAPGFRVGAFATNVAAGNLAADGGAILQEAILFAAQ